MIHAARVQRFGSADRALTTFSSSEIRIDADAGHVALKLSSRGLYPLTTNLYARLPEIAPAALRRWVAIDATFAEPLGDRVSSPTTIRWRLSDGTTDLYWNGSAWATAGASSWNTLAQIQDHIATFPTTSKRLRPVVNLATTDTRYTPVVSEVRVLFEGHQESSFVETVIRAFKDVVIEAVEPTSDLVVRWAATGTTYTLDASTLTEPLTVVDVQAAFLHTGGRAVTDILSSYVAGVVTLTQSVAADAQVRLRVIYTPTFAYSTHIDYDGNARLPAVVVQDVTSLTTASPPGFVEFVNRSSGSGWRLALPTQVTHRFTLRCETANSEESFRLAEAVQRSIRSNRLLRVAALDEIVDLVIDPGASARPGFDEVNTHEATFDVEARSALIWQKPPEAMYGVLRLVLSGDMDATS